MSTDGRRPVVDYLTKDYEGFRQGMLDRIPLLLPEWSDPGESDFGVVLIELYAYVADLLSYYQDRVANEAFLGTATQRRSVVELLRLIGYRVDPGLAASVWLHAEVSADVVVRDLPYRVRTAGRPGEPDAVFEVTREFTLRAANNAIPLGSASALPAGATSVVIDHAAHALAEGDLVYVEQPRGTRVRRTPPLRVTGVRAVSATRDEIGWLPPLPEPFQPAQAVLRGNNVRATHGESVTDEPVTVGDGTPGQRVVLSRGPVTHLLAPEAVRRGQSSPELEVRVDGARWDEVDNLAASGPMDRHYVTSLDENDVMTITFGTGTRGAVPPPGSLITVGYRVGLGGDGNVGPDTLTVFVTAVPEVSAVTNPFAATGGADRESTDEARISGPGTIIAQERAVTLADYELLARAFPGVGKARARVGLRGGYKVVEVFAAPENPRTVPPPPPAPELRAALKRHLEARMPVNRMAGVEVRDPVFVPIDVAADVHVAADASQSRVLELVTGRLRDLLSFAGQEFGRPVRAGEVFSALYAVPGVSFMVLKRLERGGTRVPDPCGFADVPIADHELAYEGTLTITLFGGRR